MSFPRYDRYVGTGLDWMPEAPEHWRLRKIAWDMPYVVGWTPPSGKSEYYDGDCPWVTIADMTKGTINDTQSKITDLAIADRKAEIVPAGSMLFSFKLSVGKVAFLSIDSYTNEAIAAFLDNQDVSLGFWKYVAPEVLPNYGRENIYGAKLLNQELIGSARFYCPGIDEQKKIAAFLDHETAKIDALIAEQQRLIELLKEKRQAVISHAVTKGLNPSAPMKDSGVEWLGEVPAHWGVSRLKFVSTIVDCKNRTPEYVDDGEYLVVRTSNIKNQQLDLSSALYTDHKNYKTWTLRGVPPEGSILFTREAPAGEVCLVPKGIPLCMGQRMMNIIPDEVGYTPFLFDYLTSDCLVRYIEAEAAGSTVTHLRVEQVYNIPVVVPPLEEKRQIDIAIRKMKASFLTLIDQAQNSVGLLKERRSSLISAAVTGKIDVRGWQPGMSIRPGEELQSADESAVNG